MTILQLNICSIIISLASLGLACYSWIKTKHVTRNRDLLIEKFTASTERFATYKRSMMENMDNLHDQLQKAATALGDAKTELQLKDKQLTQTCQLYKQLKTSHQDLLVQHSHLVGQYNDLTKRLPAEGEMPT